MPFKGIQDVLFMTEGLMKMVVICSPFTMPEEMALKPLVFLFCFMAVALKYIPGQCLEALHQHSLMLAVP